MKMSKMHPAVIVGLLGALGLGFYHASKHVMDTPAKSHYELSVFDKAGGFLQFTDANRLAVHDALVAAGFSSVKVLGAGNPPVVRAFVFYEKGLKSGDLLISTSSFTFKVLRVIS